MSEARAAGDPAVELERRAARGEFSGIVRLTRGDDVVFEARAGYASRAWRAPVLPDTRFDTASITKLFTAVAVLQQVDAGAFDLATGAADFLGLPGAAIPRTVTVRHLLTHSSGIGDDADEEAGESYEALWRDRPNYAARDAIHLLPNFLGKPANFAPGERCRYCNAGYVLLGLLVERASGVPYRDYVARHVFEPAGMARSGFFAMDRVEDDVAEGADPVRGPDGAASGWRRNIYSYPPIGTPDGGAHVTAPDLARFVRAVHDGALLSPGSTAAFLAPQVRDCDLDGGSRWWGYGPWFRRDADGRVLAWQKEGSNPGVSGLVRRYPESGLTLVVLCNEADVAWPAARLVHDAVHDGRIAT